jgi:hypothetical protein
MKLVKLILLSFFISIAGAVFSQETTKTTTQAQSNSKTTTSTQKNNIKTVPKSKLQQAQLKKINQRKSKLQSQKLKKAIRKSSIVRKKGRK